MQWTGWYVCLKYWTLQLCNLAEHRLDDFFLAEQVKLIIELEATHDLECEGKLCPCGPHVVFGGAI